MPVLADFSFAKYQDGTLTISLSPPTAIGGWNIVYNQYKRFGSNTPIFTYSVASGFNGASGITVINSGQGIITMRIREENTSGLPYGNYAGMCERMDSGYRTTLSEGYMILVP